MTVLVGASGVSSSGGSSRGVVGLASQTASRRSGRRLDDVAVLRRTVLVASINHLDGLGRASLVGPLILLAWRVVDDLDAFHELREGCFAVVDLATCPLDGALALGVSSSPDTDADVAGSLRVLVSTTVDGVGRLQSAHRLAIDEPDESIGRPIDGVGVHLLDIGDICLDHAVVSGGITLAKVVHLDFVRFSSNPLPVNLVEVVGLQHNRRDDTLPRGSLRLYLDVAVVEVALGLNGGSIACLRNGEFGAGSNVVEGPSRLLPAFHGVLAGLEVGLEGGSNRGVVWAPILLGRIAVGEGLGTGKRRESACREEKSRPHCGCWGGEDACWAYCIYIRIRVDVGCVGGQKPSVRVGR